MNELDTLLERLTQTDESGGIHIPPEMRLFLCCLARLMKAESVIETGYDAGFTTLALSFSGANVVAVDNLTQYPYVDPQARKMLAGQENVKLHKAEALEFLKSLPDESVDLAFIDDWHFAGHVEGEAQQIERILRPGGVGVFHDTRAEDLQVWPAVSSVIPDWEHISLPAVSAHSGRDYGFALVRKPNRRS